MALFALHSTSLICEVTDHNFSVAEGYDWLGRRIHFSVVEGEDWLGRRVLFNSTGPSKQWMLVCGMNVGGTSCF